jgi:hypothetical protein
MNHLDLEEMDRLRAEVAVLRMSRDFYWKSLEELAEKNNRLKTIRNGLIVAHLIIVAVALALALLRFL